MKEPVKVADISVEKVLDHMAMGKKVIDKVAETKSLSRGHTNRNTITNTPYILMNISHKGHMEDEKRLRRNSIGPSGKNIARIANAVQVTI